MKVKITKASDYNDVKISEFNTLEDLLKFQEECDEELIIARPYKRKNGEKVYDVIVYDDYVELDSDPIVPEGKKFITSYDENGNEDIEELIQCKDCEHYEITGSRFHHWCTRHEFAREPEDYCSDAERREKSND